MHLTLPTYDHNPQLCWPVCQILSEGPEHDPEFWTSKNLPPSLLDDIQDERFRHS